MRKFFIAISIMAVCATANIFCQEVIVTAVTGKVEVSKNGSEWTALAVGDKVSRGDTVSTGFRASVAFDYKTSNQSTKIELGALTRVSFDELLSQGDADNVQLAIKTGSIKTTADREEGKRISFTVKTPVAVSSVRGTQFSMATDGYVSCSRGSVFSAPSSFVGDSGTGNVHGSTVVSSGQTAVLSTNEVAQGVYDTASSSSSSVTATVSTASDASGEGTSISGMNVVGVRNNAEIISSGNVEVGEGMFLSFSFNY